MSAFDDLHDELRDVARGLLAEDVDPARRWGQVADAGWFGLEVPEHLDGSGATFAETAVVLEALGRAVAPVPFLGPAVLGVAAASRSDGGDHRDAVLRDIATGAAAVAVAFAPHADAAVAVPPFRIDAGGRLTGRADLVVDAPTAQRLLVLAEAPPGLVVVHVPADAVEVAPVPLLDATRSFGTVAAHGVAVASDASWPIEPAAAQTVLDRAAVAVAADALGVAATMLDATVAYVGVRRQFDRPIGSFQAVKHQCADALVLLRIGRELLADAVAAVAADDRDAGLAVARAKSHLGAAGVEVVGTAVQLHGGIGYTWESGIHRALKRAMVDRSLFGSPAAHRERIAELRLLA